MWLTYARPRVSLAAKMFLAGIVILPIDLAWPRDAEPKYGDSGLALAERLNPESQVRTSYFQLTVSPSRTRSEEIRASTRLLDCRTLLATHRTILSPLSYMGDTTKQESERIRPSPFDMARRLLPGTSSAIAAV